MALPCWMRVIISVIYEVAAFLVHEPHSAREVPRSPCAFDGFNPTQSTADESLGISDYMLSSISNALGLELPRAVTILNGLPLATSLLLRLTEVLPSELILFFCISGMIFWLACAMIGTVLIVVTSGLIFRFVCWPPRVLANWATQRFMTPPAPTPRPRVRAAPPQVALPPNPANVLSDEVRTFAPNVIAYNPPASSDEPLRRSTRRNTRP